ncbi:hypothetical protein J2S03_003438 [Alicyclobacillus cycloheptanicus]|uniref:Uncharacterized protein n=1 Tax=Alicyclobacillus cycloheptanicus TaxID=1457 RepID=A0ABT9XMX5_9BACL|nr:hypothetical protein [Alicyclobacillus cycloheptanicus]
MQPSPSYSFASNALLKAKAKYVTLNNTALVRKKIGYYHHNSASQKYRVKQSKPQRKIAELACHLCGGKC